MSIVKTAPRSKFTTIQNSILENPRLSFRSKGLLCYLLSKPEHWSVNVKQLATASEEGRDAVYACLKQLGEEGYIIKEPIKSGNLYNGFHYVVFDTPQNVRLPENPDTGETAGIRLTGDRLPENPSIVNTDLVNTEQVKKVPSVSVLEKKKDFISKVYEYFITKNPVYPQLMIRDFCRYWYEAGSGKKPKLRYEKEKSFEIGPRLATWWARTLEPTRQTMWAAETNGKEVDLADILKRLIED